MLSRQHVILGRSPRRKMVVALRQHNGLDISVSRWRVEEAFFKRGPTPSWRSGLTTCVLLVLLSSFSLLGKGQHPSLPQGKKVVVKGTASDLDNRLIEQQQVAVQVLRGLVSTIHSIEAPETRIRLQSHLADLMWRSDKQQARFLFESSFEAATSLRSEIVNLLIRHDPKLAEDLIETVSIEAASAQSESLEARENPTAALLAQSAASVSQANLDLAARWLQKSLNIEMTGQFTMALQTIRRLDPSLADGIFRHAMMRSEALATNNSNLKVLLTLSSYVFDPEGRTEFMVGDAGNSYSVPIGFGAPTTTPRLTEQFLKLAHRSCTETLSIDPNTIERDPNRVATLLDKVIAIAAILPMFERHLPNAVPALTAQLENILKALKIDDAPSWEELMELLRAGGEREGSFLEQAEKERDPVKKNSLYQEAADVALQKGDTDQLREILNIVTSESARLQIQARRVSQQVIQAIKQDDLESAYDLVKTLPLPSDQCRHLIDLAIRQAGKNDPARALQWFNEAEQLAGRVEEADSRLDILLALFEGTAQLGVEQGLTFGTLLVAYINKQASLPTNITQLILRSRALTILAQDDFEAVLRLAQSIQIREASVAAQIAVCRGILGVKARSPRRSEPRR